MLQIDQSGAGVGVSSLHWSVYFFLFFLSLRSLVIAFPITVTSTFLLLSVKIHYYCLLSSVNLIIAVIAIVVLFQ